DKWRIEIWRCYKKSTYGSYVKFFRNSRLILRFRAIEMGEHYLMFDKAKFTTRFPMIVLDAVPSAGHSHTIRLYTIRHGRLIQRLQIEGQYGGPIFRDYDGDGQ